MAVACASPPPYTTATDVGHDAAVEKQTLQGGVMVLARVRPSQEENFVQVLLPLAMSHETFVCKLCVALGVRTEDVKKIVRLPDVLIRSTEDVVRLRPYDKLEIRIHRPTSRLLSNVNTLSLHHLHYLSYEASQPTLRTNDGARLADIERVLRALVNDQHQLHRLLTSQIQWLESIDDRVRDISRERSRRSSSKD